MNSRKYFFDYDNYEIEELRSEDLVNRALSDPELPQLNEIIIGCFGAEPCDADEGDCTKLLNAFIQSKDKFSHIESFFIGDMDSEECEVSWIAQSNYNEFMKAFPNMKKLVIKGSAGLGFGNLEHSELRHLEIICGGLPKNVLLEIINSKLPKLETLILYLGVDYYGFDGAVEDLKLVASKELFPNLKHLGIVNSEEQDKITEIVMDSCILKQLEVLQLSYGTLSDKGAKILLNNKDKILHLKKLDLNYNYLSAEMVDKLSELPIEVDASDRQCLDESYDEYFPMLTE
jgi:hypothetical protein